MKRSPVVGNGFLVLALLAASLVMGCSTYHYFDITVEFGPVTSEQASQLQICAMTVSGADSHSGDFPSSVVGLGTGQTSVCPPVSNYPTMGTFEYATFTDSGSLTFTVSAYKSLMASSSNLCTSGSTSLNASSQITTPGTITMGTFDTTNCPSMTTMP